MLLLGGQLVSWLGTEITTIALPLVVLALTDSPAKAGSAAAIRGLAYILWAIPAGALVDRWDRRKVMVISNLGSGLAVGSIALALKLDNLSVIWLYIACAVEGSFFVFANLVRLAVLPKVVSEAQFPAASAQMNTAGQSSMLAGPPLGGFLFQTLGGFVTFLADSISYFVNAISVFFINIPLKPETVAERKALHHEVRAAASWYRTQPVMRFLNIMTAGRVATDAGLYLLIVVLAKQHHASSFSIGLIFAVSAAGGIMGSMISAKVHARFQLRQLLVGVSLTSAVIFGLFAFAGNIFALALIAAVYYAVDPLFHLTTYTYSAKLIPDDMRGRVSSFTRLQVLAAHSLGFFISGLTLQYLGSSWTIGLFLSLLAFLFIALATNSRLSKKANLV
jgi:predicted MFS family arabinose efflux permease